MATKFGRIFAYSILIIITSKIMKQRMFHLRLKLIPILLKKSRKIRFFWLRHNSVKTRLYGIFEQYLKLE